MVAPTVVVTLVNFASRGGRGRDPPAGDRPYPFRPGPLTTYRKKGACSRAFYAISPPRCERKKKKKGSRYRRRHKSPY